MFKRLLMVKCCLINFGSYVIVVEGLNKWEFTLNRKWNMLLSKSKEM